MKSALLLGALLFAASVSQADGDSAINQALSTNPVNTQDANQVRGPGGPGGGGGQHGGQPGGGGFGGGGQHGGGQPGGNFGGGQHGPVGQPNGGFNGGQHGPVGQPNGGFNGGQHGPVGQPNGGFNGGHGGPGFPGGNGFPHGGPGFPGGHFGGNHGGYYPVPVPYPIQVGGQLTCQSYPGQTNACGVGFPISYATIVRQYSARQCIDGYTFGLAPDRLSVWVSDGCSATFLIQ